MQSAERMRGGVGGWGHPPAAGDKLQQVQHPNVYIQLATSIKPKGASSAIFKWVINPRRACAARVTVLGLCVCVCVCVSVTQHLTFHLLPPVSGLSAQSSLLSPVPLLLSALLVSPSLPFLQSAAARNVLLPQLVLLFGQLVQLSALLVWSFAQLV